MFQLFFFKFRVFFFSSFLFFFFLERFRSLGKLGSAGFYRDDGNLFPFFSPWVQLPLRDDKDN